MPKGTLSEPRRQRLCPECSTPYIPTGHRQTTCGTDVCRQRRVKRLQRDEKAGIGPAERAARDAEIREIADSEALGIARDIMREELAPVVREQLSEDVLAAIGDMVALTPLLVAALADDLVAEYTEMHTDPEGFVTETTRTDYKRRAAAVALLAKYTIGSPALAPQPEAADAQPLQVNFFGMPRPAWDAEGTAALPDDTSSFVLPAGAGAHVPGTPCDVCGRTDVAFVEQSTRCTDCHAEIRARGMALLTAERPEALPGR